MPACLPGPTPCPGYRAARRVRYRRPRGCRPGRHPGSWFSASPSDLSWLTIAGSSSFPVSAQLPHIPVRVTTGDYIRRLLAINPVRQSTATPRNLGKCRASSGARHNEGRLLRRRGAAQRSAPITVGTEGLPQRSRMSWQRGDRMATGDTCQAGASPRGRPGVWYVGAVFQDR